MTVSERTRALRRGPWLVDIYRSAVGKKYVMAITGILLLAWLTAHMIGNLHVFEGPEPLNVYSEHLRKLLEPIAPRGFVLWILRIGLILAFVFHIHAAYGLTLINRRARGRGVRHPKDYVAADYASRTMRWTGVIVGLFTVYHLMDLSWGNANPDFQRGEVYHNLVVSFQQPLVAIVYILSNLALGLHVYHGAWSLFQSMGWNHPRFNHWRRWFAGGFAIFLTAGFIAVPIAVMVGLVE